MGGQYSIPSGEPPARSDQAPDHRRQLAEGTRDECIRVDGPDFSAWRKRTRTTPPVLRVFMFNLMAGWADKSGLRFRPCEAAGGMRGF